MKYFKIYDIIYVKQKTEGILVVTGLYPNETDRKRSGTRTPLLSDEITLNIVISGSCIDI